MSDLHNFADKHDDIQDILNNELADSCGSAHQSDIDSDVGELFDLEVLNEVEEQYIGYNNDVEVNDDDFEEVIEEQFSNSEAISEEQGEGNGEEDQAVGIEERERKRLLKEMVGKNGLTTT
ncbi:hypothetical protein J6590_038306 [Homalodisca vitripennis]|nr:hypothetical protein J6590_038306 [Homalodisca vitripennis]